MYLYTDPETGLEHRIDFPTAGPWTCSCGSAQNKTRACKAVYSVLGAYEWFPRDYRGELFYVKGYEVFREPYGFPLVDLRATSEGHIFDMDGDS